MQLSEVISAVRSIANAPLTFMFSTRALHADAKAYML